jgi:hypothetical protein
MITFVTEIGTPTYNVRQIVSDTSSAAPAISGDQTTAKIKTICCSRFNRFQRAEIRAAVGRAKVEGPRRATGLPHLT